MRKPSIVDILKNALTAQESVCEALREACNDPDPVINIVVLELNQQANEIRQKTRRLFLAAETKFSDFS